MRELKRILAVAAAAGILTATAADAALILNNASTGRYNSGLGTALDTSGSLDPFPCANSACGDLSVSFAAAPSLAAAAGSLGNWLGNPASPGGTWTAAQAIPLSWAVNTETAIIYEINAGTGLVNLSLSLGVDNGVFVWLDGNYRFGARAAGGAALGEYTLGLPDLAGKHYLQILREDHGGGTGFAIQLTGDRSPIVSVPEPSGIALLGLAVIAALRRRARG